MSDLAVKDKKFNSKIIHCHICPRLIKYCKKIALEKRKAYLNEEYWGKPVPSIGGMDSELLIIGLAPAAHGANRTGRMFTGDRSGEWLYRALYKAGFSSQPESHYKNDGLTLINTRITAAVHCAPPDNKPNTSEIKNCGNYLKDEIKQCKNLKVICALGKIAYDRAWSELSEKPIGIKKPRFSHGTEVIINNIHLIASYHPSQQNTFTKRLTEKMFDQIFTRVKSFLLASQE